MGHCVMHQVFHSIKTYQCNYCIFITLNINAEYATVIENILILY